MSLFESYERRIDQITPVLEKYDIKDLDEARQICLDKGFDPYEIVKGVQPICFENACWAYTLGAAIAVKQGCVKASDAAKAIGEGLQAFCIPGSVADDRQVGLGHGNLASMLLSDESECFAFLAGHESFAAAEGAIGIANSANEVREKPLRVILNGLGKDAALIISRINGFTHVETEFDYFTGEVKIVKEKAYSDGERAKVRCYGADDVREGVAIMHLEGVDVSITGNSTNPTRFQHPVAGTYKKECILEGIPIIVMQRIKPITKFTTKSSRPETKNQMTFTIKENAPPSYSTSLPKGHMDKEAILKHCTPTGIPNMVMHQRIPAKNHINALIKPPQINHKTFPKKLILIPPHE